MQREFMDETYAEVKWTMSSVLRDGWLSIAGYLLLRFLLRLECMKCNSTENDQQRV